MANLPEPNDRDETPLSTPKKRIEPKLNIIPQLGERALIVGQTGSGKTAFATWLLRHIPQSPVIIYDTKIEPKFEALPHSAVVESTTGIHELLEQNEHDYIIVRPNASLLADWQTLDKYLLYHYNYFHGLPAYIDEAYTFHSQGGGSGPGLMALLTRGRSKGITTIISSQRPKRISIMCITEAQKLFAFRLQFIQDRKRIDELIDDYSKFPNPPKHHFYFVDMAETEKPVLMSPVKLDEKVKSGYTDQVESAEAEAPRSSIWI